MFSPLRSTCYGLTLACAISSTIIGFIAAFIDDPVVVRTRGFGLCLGVFSFFAWLWISILTAYHDHEPNPKDVLSRAPVHTTSYAIMVPPWLAFGIGLLVQAPRACSTETDDPAKCGLIVTSGLLSIVGAFLAASCIFAVRRSDTSANNGKPEAYAEYTPLRTALYALTLTATVLTSTFGLAAAPLDTFAPHLSAFGICISVVSLPGWIWLSILTSYHMRPDANQFLTRASTHFYTFVAMIPPFLAFGIGTLSQQSYNCNTTQYSDGSAPGWCGVTVVAGGLSLLVAVLSAATALAIQLSRAGTGLQRNVCLKSGDSAEKLGDDLVVSAAADA
ncbi:hypothetical protein D9619_009990 [Psilocybe cf. subviscida]|uniref:Uncharacterized protein n=1 Tax=Psilocybe cf. subviscida TaxID=2480587 RepID=A0A8H5BNU3_9AGAR|nr:hypothetical protein D9619_009990 [Psilocybe cf. subviscida]